MAERQEIPPHSRISARISGFLTLMRENIRGFWASSIFTKLATIVGLIGGIVAATLSGQQLIVKIFDILEAPKKVKAYLVVGDQFRELLEFERAIEEYKKGAELDKENIEISREIITTMRQRLEHQALEERPAASDINEALE